MAAAWSVVVVGIRESTYPVKVAENEADFKKTTIKQLRMKIFDLKKDDGIVTPENMRLLFAGKQLVDEDPSSEKENTFEDYGIIKRSTIAVVMRMPGGSDTADRARVPLPPDWAKDEGSDKGYPSKFALKFTDDPDCIDPYSDGPKRVKMKCGHAVDPNTLTAYCRSLIDRDVFQFTCPAIVDGDKEKCEKEWDYTEVRLAALLNDAEMQYFESKMSEHAALQYCDLKECPGCRSFVERVELDNLRVHCTICTKKKGNDYDFCWHCLREWTGPMKSSVKCGNESCVHPDLPSIRDAPDFVLNGQNVPNRRACPTCGKVTEHLAEGCKFMLCPRCKNDFCFMCLELKEVCLKSAPQSWFGNCGKPVAPKQIVIPCWSRGK